MIEDKMVDLLLADAGVAAIAGDRVFPVVVRQTTAFPSVIYRRLPGGERTYSLAGRGGMTTVTVALYGWATSYTTARSLADAIRDALDAYTSNGSTDIQLASVTDGADEWIEELGAFGCGVEVRLMFMEV